MNCTEFQAKLHPFVDGELPVAEMAAGEAHRAECLKCAALVLREREFRLFLRRQPREAAPEALRTRIRARLRSERRAGWKPWLVGPALGAVAALLVAMLLPVWRATPVVGDLVDKHIAYSQLERPAELASTDPAEIAHWFRQRAALQVTVPDYSPSGIRLVGARLAETHERRVAYLLYEKGRTLLSVFMVPGGPGDPGFPGDPVTYRGHEYTTHEHKGYRTVSWTDGQAIFGLVSALDYDALLECADRLRAERARSVRL
jgi:anti-sigma factor RsiW